jgi:predicted PurR-regulated permease PerM
LYYGKPFPGAFPDCFAAGYADLPLSVKLERKMNKALAILISMSVLLVALCIIISVFAWQVSDISDKAPQIQKNISQKICTAEGVCHQHAGHTRTAATAKNFKATAAIVNRPASLLTGVFLFGSFLTDFIIVMVYIFLFLLYRNHFQKFVLKLVPQQEQENAKEIMHDARQVAQKYLTGMAIMIACLWVMYSIGFSIAGVDNAIFFAILCGLLEIVPFVGNLIGVSFTLLMSLAQGGETIHDHCHPDNVCRGAVCPNLFTGANGGRPRHQHQPCFTIVGLVGGELLWGMPGMILALPLLGIIKIFVTI